MTAFNLERADTEILAGEKVKTQLTKKKRSNLTQIQPL